MSKKPFWDHVMILYTDNLIMNGSTNKVIKKVTQLMNDPKYMETELRSFLHSDIFIQHEIMYPDRVDPSKNSMPKTLKISVTAFCDVITDYPWDFMEQIIENVYQDLPPQGPFYDEIHPLYKIVHACACTDTPDAYINYVFEKFPVSSDVIVFLFLYYAESWEKYVHFISRCVDKTFLAKKVLAQCSDESQIDAIFSIVDNDDTILPSTTNLNTLRFLCDRIALPRQQGLLAHIRSPTILKIMLEGKAYDGTFDDLEEGFIQDTLFVKAIQSNCHRTIQYLYESMDCIHLEEEHVNAFLVAERSTQALIETMYSLTRVFKGVNLVSIVDAIRALKKHSVYLLRILTRFVEEKAMDSNKYVISAISHVLSLAQGRDDIIETLYIALPIIDHNVTAYFAIHHPNVMKIAHEEYSLRFHCSVVLNSPIVCLFELPLHYSINDESLDYIKSIIDGIKTDFCLEDTGRIPSLVYAHDGDKITTRPASSERYNISMFNLNKNGSNPFYKEHYFHNARVSRCYTKNHPNTYSVTVEFTDFDPNLSHTTCTGSFLLSQQGERKPSPAIVPRDRWEHARNIEKERIKEEFGIPSMPCFDIYSASFNFEKEYFVKIMTVYMDDSGTQNEDL